MRTLVMGDIHGSYKALIQCLERSGFDYEFDRLIQLGDVADGYPDVYECVEELLKIKNLISVRGNHDVWFREFMETGYHAVGWNYGGKATALSFLKLTGRQSMLRKGREGYKTALNPGDIPPGHQHFFRNQPLYYIDDDNNCYVHAGFNRFLSLRIQREETFYWDRELWTEALSHHIRNLRDPDPEPFFNISGFHEIYIGHTSTMNWGTDKPMRAINILNMDTGAGHSGKLTVLDIKTKEYWQSDKVDELYEANFRELQNDIIKEA